MQLICERDLISDCSASVECLYVSDSVKHKSSLKVSEV